MLAKLFKRKAKEASAPDGEGAEKTSSPEDQGEGDTENPKSGRKTLFLIIGAGVLVLLAAGAGAYVFLTPAEESASASADTYKPPLTPPTIAYYDVPEIIVNIQTAEGAPAYLKLGVSLELNSPEEKNGLQVLMPRVVDQFQAYLRELRVDDLKGSAGVMRLKEELLRRINLAAAPYQVRDVLLKEMIVQ